MKPPGQIARRTDYCVKVIKHAEGAAFISALHYAKGCANTSVFMHGLFKGEQLVGVAHWIPPTKSCALSVHAEWRRVLSLSRVVLAGAEPTNAESFFVGRSIRLVWRDPRWVALVTYADESQKHTGVIYRATNWRYVGRTKPEARWVDASGRQVARKAGGHTRTVAEMQALGCVMVGRFSKHKFVLERKASPRVFPGGVQRQSSDFARVA